MEIDVAGEKRPVTFGPGLARIVNRIVLIAFALVVQGLNSFGQTNSSSAPARPLPQPAPPLRPTAERDAAGISFLQRTNLVAGETVLFSKEADPAETAVFRRIEREGLFKPRSVSNDRDYGKMLSGLFRSGNDQMGESSIRDTVITIFPSGR